MSYYRTIKSVTQLCMNSRCYIISSGLSLRSKLLNEHYNYLRVFSSLSNVGPKVILPKLEDVRTQINSLLADTSALETGNTILALHYCGKSSPSLTVNQRRALTKEIWESLSDYNDISICHSYIQACIENDEYVDYLNFLNTIKFKPNIETYKLLLESVCNIGNKELALNMLEIMKNNNHPADIDVFNLLLLGYSINGFWIGVARQLF